MFLWDWKELVEGRNWKRGGGVGRGKGERERREVIDGFEDLEVVGRDGI